MQVTRTNPTDTTVKLAITASQDEIDVVKQRVVEDLGKTVRLQGFRPGKAPAAMIEKSLDQSRLQSDFLETIVNELYVQAANQEQIRPIKAPDVSITKFVPFTTVEFSADVEVIGKITLPDYKKIRLAKPPVKVAAKDVDEVITNLRSRAADKEDVKRESKLGDQVIIDFKGVDAKTKEPISGADGDNYPLVLGSKSFIPGFEEELVGLKAGSEKTFTITFPKDYGVASLQSRKVSFTITVHTVQKVVEPKLDDAFAASVGPFKSLTELKDDIKKQLQAEREQQARSDYNNQLLEKLAEQTKVSLPKSLVEAEIDRMEEEERRNLVYRGQTWQEHLDAEGLTEEAHREKNRAGAELRVTAGLILSEVAEEEKITVSQEEVDVQLDLMRGRYSDPKMLAEIDNPDNQREIVSRILSEKTIDKLASYATAK